MAKRFRYKHITSSVENKIPDTLYGGEIAVNQYSGNEKLYIKNSGMEIVSFIPEHTVNKKITAEETRAKAAESDRYTKSETYTKAEVNGLVDSPHQEYVTVATYAELPASGSTDTIYRVSNYDGSTSQVDATMYSEYAWNGTQYIFLCVKSQIGEVFDISEYNNNETYVDIADALRNDGDKVPISVRKGGMTVKFVQSPGNKYVQYRLMSTTFSTTVDDWQGVDDEPTASSENLVKSGGVHDMVSELDMKIEGGYIDIQPLYPSTPTYPRAIVDIKAGTKVVLTKVKEGASYVTICESEDGENVTAELNKDVVVPFNATLIKTSPSAPADIEIFAYGDFYDNIKATIDETKTELETKIASNTTKINEIDMRIEGGYIDIQPLYPGTPTYPRAIVDIKAGTKVVLTKVKEGASYVTICESEDGENVTAELNKDVVVPFNATLIKTSPSAPADIEIFAYGKFYENIEATIDETKTELETKIASNTTKINEIDSAISSKVPFEDLVATETISSVIIRASDGKVVDVGLEQYMVLKYDVSEFVGTEVRINAKANYGNAYYVIKDINDSVLDIMASPGGSTWTTLDNKDVVLPENSKYIFVADRKSDSIASVSLLKKEYGITAQIWKGLKWGLVGDSLTDAVNRSRTSKYYYEYISEKTGIECINVAKSGSSYGKPQDTGNAFFQQAAKLPSDVDVVTVFGSFNGWGVDVTGNIDDTEPTTRYGCINKCINTIHEINPIAQIGIVTPTPWSTDGYNPFVDDNGNNWGEAYIERLKEVCKKRGLAFLDLYHESELRPWDASYRSIVYSKDSAGLDGNPAGVHPNEIGHKIIASHFQSLLERLLLH